MPYVTLATLGKPKDRWHVGHRDRKRAVAVIAGRRQTLHVSCVELAPLRRPKGAWS